MLQSCAHRWGTHVPEGSVPADAAYLVYARPGFAILGMSGGNASRPVAAVGAKGPRRRAMTAAVLG